MNKKLRLLSFCIALCTIFSGVNAVANSMVKMSDASFFSAFYEYGGDGLRLAENAVFEDSYMDQLDKKELAIYNTLEKNIDLMRENKIMQFEIPVPVKAHRDNESEMNKLQTAIYNAVYAFELDRGDLFWMSKYHSYKYSYDTNSGEIKKLYLYAYNDTWHGSDFATYESVKKAEEKFNAAIDAVKKEIQDLGTYAQVKYIHDFILNNCTYNKHVSQGYGPDTLGELPWSAYSALVKQTDEKKYPVCEAYVKGFNVLCKSVGINAAAVSGFVEGRNHMWSAVKMQNKIWFYVDTTFDDSAEDYNYYYFLRGYEYMNHTHVPDGRIVNVCDEFTYPKCSKKDYPQDAGDLLGDVNQDKVVNTGDATFLLKYSAGIISLPTAARLYGDFNCDDSYNTADASAILRFCAS